MELLPSARSTTLRRQLLAATSGERAEEGAAPSPRIRFEWMYRRTSASYQQWQTFTARTRRRTRGRQSGFAGELRAGRPQRLHPRALRDCNSSEPRCRGRREGVGEARCSAKVMAHPKPGRRSVSGGAWRRGVGCRRPAAASRRTERLLPARQKSQQVRHRTSALQNPRRPLTAGQGVGSRGCRVGLESVKIEVGRPSFSSSNARLRTLW